MHWLAYPHAFGAGLLPAALIQYQARFAQYIRQRRLYATGYFVHHGLPIPAGRADEMVLTIRQLPMQARPETDSVADHVGGHFFAVIGNTIPLNLRANPGPHYLPK